MKESGNTVRINKDLLRTMLHFDKFTGKNEGLTREAARALARHFLTRGENGGMNVIIDDTNLNPGTVQGWKDLAKEIGAKIEYADVDTDVATCLERDRKREKQVGEHVIMGMALASGRYPKPEKGFVLCDLDGTLCDISHRLPFVKVPEGQAKDWKSFFAAIPNDTVRTEVLDQVLALEEQGYEVIFMSARPDTYREQTEAWLEKALNGYKLHKTLIMRRSDDQRPDSEVKLGMYESYFKDKYPIHTVFDDRPVVIRMWREQGLNVIDVGPGIEF